MPSADDQGYRHFIENPRHRPWPPARRSRAPMGGSVRLNSDAWQAPAPKSIRADCRINYAPRCMNEIHVYLSMNGAPHESS